MSVTYNNIRNIEGYNCATSVTLEFNSGVYLTAIKPTMVSMKAGWKTKVGNWCLSCTNISNRNDNNQEHLLCTQASLQLQDMNNPLDRHKATLHLYHTASKIQVQGSSFISKGVSCASWIAKNVIEPLADTHIVANHDNIAAVNSSIVGNRDNYSCFKCSQTIKHSPGPVKELPLTCRKCGKIFHKKCTDRKDSRGKNWDRDPWFCTDCVFAPSMSSHTLSNIPAIEKDNSRPGPDTNDQDIIEITSVDDQEPSTHSTQVCLPPPRAANASLSNSTPRFPNNSIRQRGSNIPITDPEKEFQKTALDSCRSTIVTQEAELRKLNESLDVRNKRIIQLENQVTHAASYVAERPCITPGISIADTPHGASDTLTTLHTKLDLILKTCSSPVNNININNGNSRTLLCAETQNKSTQTVSIHTIEHSTMTTTPSQAIPSELSENALRKEDLEASILTCTICGKTFETVAYLDTHMESSHDEISTPKDDHELFPCDMCSMRFTSNEHLKEHSETNHVLEPLCCERCEYKCKSKSHLSYHMVSCHNVFPGSQVITVPSAPAAPSTPLPQSL